MFRRPRKERARKRHRGGGGLAVPGPFKRIARAGGEKVTIRFAKRGVFAFSSGPCESFLATAVTTLIAEFSRRETQVNQRCSDRVFDRATNEVAWPVRRR